MKLNDLSVIQILCQIILKWDAIIMIITERGTKILYKKNHGVRLSSVSSIQFMHILKPYYIDNNFNIFVFSLK